MHHLPQPKQTTLASLCMALMSLLPVPSAMALEDALTDPTHFDIFIDTQPPAQSGARLRVDPEGNFPVDVLSGRTVVPTNLSDLSGGSYLTDDPGWFMEPGFLIGGEDLRFRALGALRYWNPDAQRWLESVPNGETIRIFGGVPADIVPDLFADPDLFDFWLGGTIWTTAGIEGPVEALIAQTSASGEGNVHSHLDFCIQDASGDCPARIGGNPTKGAFLIELELFSGAQTGGGSKYIDSEPVLIVLGNALTANELQQAVDSLITLPDSGQAVPQLPAAGILIMGGP